jgi:hypothetical protein
MEQAALQGSVAEIETLGASLVVVTPAVLCAIRTLPPGNPRHDLRYIRVHLR